MRKIKLFKYDFAPPHLHDATPGYEDSVPFSEAGIAKHCELVDPKDAELFYCGQWDNFMRVSLELHKPHPSFDYFNGNEHRHVIDFEGDWIGDFPQWTRPMIITAMNAHPEHTNWNVMVRGGCSQLLMDMVKHPRPFTEPMKKGFFFAGQPDPHGLRQKVLEALNGLGGVEWRWNSQWNAVTPIGESVVRKYEKDMLLHSFALCPGGTGMGMTCRFFEACGLGRIPIVIADNWLFGATKDYKPFRHGASVSIPILANFFKELYRLPPSWIEHYCRQAHEFFEDEIKPYFDDPTLYFLKWAQARGYIEPL